MTYKTLDDYDFAGKRVLVRVDINVPMHDLKVSDNSRMVLIEPTIRYLLDSKAKIILLAHLGRPEAGKGAFGDNFAYSLKHLLLALAGVLGRNVLFCEDCVGPKATAAVAKLKDGQILLLENTRFHEGEMINDPKFAKSLAALGDVFVDDAFSVAHRSHASNVGVARLLPSFIGLAMQKEVDALTNAIEDPEKPLMAIVGGAKVSTKLELLTRLIKKVDILALGGGMANTFLAAQGKKMGNSLVEKDLFEVAKLIMEHADSYGCEILLPLDAVVSDELATGAAATPMASINVPKGYMMLDIGIRTIELYRKKLKEARTLVWNGPLGAFEYEPFHRGTREVAVYAANLTEKNMLKSYGGGGDTQAALNTSHVADKFTYVSSAGGAFLEWLEGKELPGLAVLGYEQGSIAAK